MNPEIEKLMESKNPSRKRADSPNDDDNNDAEVSTNEMAKAFKKFKTQHRHSRK